jgi:hypothetical protein
LAAKVAEPSLNACIGALRYNGDDWLQVQFPAILKYLWEVKHEKANSFTSADGDVYGRL